MSTCGFSTVNINSLYRLIPFLICVFTFAGCSTWQQPSDRMDPLSGTAPLLSNHWSVTAKVGINSSGKSGSAIMQWQQNGRDYAIKFSGPLGQQIGMLQKTDDSVLWADYDGTQTRSTSEEELSFSLTGQPLPVSAMQFWLKGLKAPFIPVIPVHASINTMEFQQKNWNVAMANFTNIDGYRLPQRLRLTYPAVANGDETVEIKIIVKSWDISKHITSL